MTDIIAKGVCRDTGYPVEHRRNTGPNADLWPSYWFARNPHNPTVRVGVSQSSKADAVADMLAKNPQLIERLAA